MRKLLMIAAVISWASSVAAQTPSPTTPHYLHYHSTFLDEGGTPLPDGSASVTFRVLGSDDRVLYQEQQSLEVMNGEVAALLGNGLDPASGAPTGGLSIDLFTPGESRYLEVEVEGYPPTGQMEIVSVPYALYSEEALGVAASSIDSTALAEKSVEFKHFGDETLEELATALLDQGLLTPGVTQADLTTTYREPTGAAQIGVASGLVYSAENNVQAVLRDIDRAVDKRQANIDAETEARTDAVSDLEDRKLSRSGGAMTGNITMADGVTIDGYDVGATLTTINATLTNINNIPGTLDEAKIDTDMTLDTELTAGLATKLSLSGGTITGPLTIGSSTESENLTIYGDLIVDGSNIETTLTTISNNITTISNTIDNINDIPGTLGESKIDDTMTRDSELQSEVNLLNEKIDGLEGQFSTPDTEQPSIEAWWYYINPPGGTALEGVTFTGQNITSIRNLGTGVYRVEFSENFPSANYTLLINGSGTTATIENQTISSFDTSVVAPSTDNVDNKYFFSVVCCASTSGVEVDQ